MPKLQETMIRFLCTTEKNLLNVWNCKIYWKQVFRLLGTIKGLKHVCLPNQKSSALCHFCVKYPSKNKKTPLQNPTFLGDEMSGNPAVLVIYVKYKNRKRQLVWKSVLGANNRNTTNMHLTKDIAPSKVLELKKSHALKKPPLWGAHKNW